MELEGSYPVHKSPSLVSSPYRNRDKSSPRLPILFLVILSSHLHLGFLSGFFPLGFPTNPCVHFPPIRAKCPAPPYSPWFDDLYNTGRSIYIKYLFNIMVSPASCHFLCLRPKYPLSTLFSNTLSLLSSLNQAPSYTNNTHKTRKIHPIRIVSTWRILQIWQKAVLSL